MNKTRVTTKYCKLSGKQVSVKMKAIYEMQSKNPVEYIEDSCLDKDKLKCLELNCSFTAIGGQYPF